MTNPTAQWFARRFTRRFARWFAPVTEADLPDLATNCGKRGQNVPAIRALLHCLQHRLPIHASQSATPIRAAGTTPAPLVYCQSSGSGGQPKTIRRSHASWIASFEINRTMFNWSAQDCYAVLGHLGHSLSLYATLEALHLGAKFKVLAGDSPRSQIQQLARGNVSIIYATPTQLRRLQLAAGYITLPSVSHIICGGGKLDPACRAGMAKLCPNAAIHEFYGSTEASFITISDRSTPEGSVGRAYPGVHIQLEHDGEIIVSSPYLFDGYTDPDMPPPQSGGFIHTGDIGHLDAAGHLYIRGRKSRMVTVADHNLSLADIENVMIAAGAGFCAALAAPDPQRGQAIIAIVEGEDDSALASHLRRACRAALGDHAMPRQILFVPQLPQLASGKPDLATLARQFGTSQ